MALEASDNLLPFYASFYRASGTWDSEFYFSACILHLGWIPLLYNGGSSVHLDWTGWPKRPKMTDGMENGQGSRLWQCLD